MEPETSLKRETRRAFTNEKQTFKNLICTLKIHIQPETTCSKLTIKALEESVK